MPVKHRLQVCQMVQFVERLRSLRIILIKRYEMHIFPGIGYNPDPSAQRIYISRYLLFLPIYRCLLAKRNPIKAARLYPFEYFCHSSPNDGFTV
jgi:hypothetical protein